MDAQDLKNSLLRIAGDLAKIAHTLTQEDVDKFGKLREHVFDPKKDISKESTNQPQPEKPPEKSIDELLKHAVWPQAVQFSEIVQTEQDKQERAEIIANNLLEVTVKDKKFLDFGGGEGHVAQHVCKQQPALSVSYDIQIPDNQIIPWETTQDKLLLTSDLNKVKENGPYDVVMLHDVLDHSEDPVAVLNTIREVLAPTGRVYVRNHPWCSRHGAHLYHSLNKAFAHLFMTDEEILALDKNFSVKQKVLFPMKTYDKWFNEAKFKARPNNSERDVVEKFFHSQKNVGEYLFKLWGNIRPYDYMEQTFIDYVLTI